MAIQLSISNLSVITHANQPVITTELLAQLYGTDAIRIRQNHKRNISRFICGKHYFKITGEELACLRVTLSDLQSLRVSSRYSQISPKTRSLILWTERGAARHAKMLETDQAWEVFEKLEDYYFNQKNQDPIISSLPKRFLVTFDNGQQTAQAIPDDACVMTVKEMISRVANGEIHVTNEQLHSFIVAAVDRLYRRNEYLMKRQ